MRTVEKFHLEIDPPVQCSSHDQKEVDVWLARCEDRLKGKVQYDLDEFGQFVVLIHED